jgi:hypothetical protein
MPAIATPHPKYTESLFAELDYRESDGIEVSLLWNRSDDSLSVYVSDIRTNDTFELPVTAAHAREVFLHPYAHAGVV